MTVIRGDQIPRASDEPCDPDCPGWAVFDCERCTVHEPDGNGEPCDCYEPDCSTLEIFACDACWYQVSDAPGDEYYQAHPVCLEQLAKERKQEKA